MLARKGAVHGRRLVWGVNEYSDSWARTEGLLAFIGLGLHWTARYRKKCHKNRYNLTLHVLLLGDGVSGEAFFSTQNVEPIHMGSAGNTLV